MNVIPLLLCVCLIGQVPQPPSPQPPEVRSPGEQTILDQPPPQSRSLSEQLKTYLLTRLTIDLNFDQAKLREVTTQLDRMDERQLQILANTYYERAQARKRWEEERIKAQQALVLNQAQLNLERARAYRDHLAREYQRRLVQQQMEQNLVQQGIQWQQQMMNNSFYGWGGGGGWPYRSWDRRWR